MPLNLAAEQRSEFFTWFHLVPMEPAATAEGAQAWHRFRPSGPAFHGLAELDILAAADGTIRAASLGLDRSFIDDRRNGVFARDIAKSFLAWALRNPSPQISALIANLDDLSGGLVIMRGPPPAPPPPDRTGGYNVYLGKAENVSFEEDGVTIDFANLPGPLPSGPLFAPSPSSENRSSGRWLKIDLRFRDHAPPKKSDRGSVFAALTSLWPGRTRPQ
ncbi:MAG TPA: hypothetical protein VKV77_13365 [Methylovirgula sp.]|nr:hypothetical protein [Methylovirgula sp.]